MRNPLRRRPGLTPRQVVALLDTTRVQAYEQGMARGEALARQAAEANYIERDLNRGWDECVAALHDARLNKSWREYHAILNGEVDRTTTTENRN